MLKLYSNNKLPFLLIIPILIYSIANFFVPIISDEFHEAVEVFHLFDNGKFPYRDYLYYKNVLGYYLKYPFLLLTSDWFISIILSRIVLGILWVISLYQFIKTNYSKFSDQVVYTSLFLALSLTQNILHAGSYRVDLLTCLAGMLSFTFYKRERYFISGILAGLSFFVSQKGVWFCLAGFFSIWFAKGFSKYLLSYLRGGVLTGFLYVGFFSFFSSPEKVLYGIFLKDLSMAGSAGYNIRHFWSQSFFENWPFYLSSLFGFSLLHFDKNSETKFDPYPVLVIILFAFNPQSWPYNFVILTPFLVPYSLVFFERLNFKISKALIFSLIGVFLVLIQFFNLVTNHELMNDHQKFNVRLLQKILNDPKDTYLAGFNILPNHQQTHSFFNWLNAIERNKSYSMKRETVEEILLAIRKSPPKAILRNYRLNDINPIIAGYLFSHYRHYWGNVYLPIVSLKKGESDNSFPFTGTYLLIPKDIPQKNSQPSSSTNPQEYKDEVFRANDKSYYYGNIFEVKEKNIKLGVKKDSILLYFPENPKLPMAFKNERNLNFTYD